MSGALRDSVRFWPVAVIGNFRPKAEIRLVSTGAEAYDSTSHIRSRPPDLA